MDQGVATRSQAAMRELQLKLEELTIERDSLRALTSGDAQPGGPIADVAGRRLQPIPTQTAGSANSGFKLRPPSIPRFAGEREKSVDWMLAIDRRLAATGDTDTLAGLEFATGHFEDFAAVWWRYFSATKPAVGSWAALRPHFELYFKLVGEEELYEKRLLEVKQRSTVDEYVTEFLKCAVRLPSLSDGFKQRRFRQGLCSRLRNDFATRRFETLDAMVMEALQLVTVLDAHLLVPDADADLPVVAAMQGQRPGYTPQGTIICYSCSKPGHRAIQCPTVPHQQVQKRQSPMVRPAAGQNPRPRGTVPMGRYNGGGRVHNIEADVVEDESDDELRQGNDQA